MHSDRITVLLGAAAKGSGAFIQLAIWPIMALALGSSEFQLFAVIWGATNWLSQTALGLPVGLSQTLLAARAGKLDLAQTTNSGLQLFLGFTSFTLFLVFAVILSAEFFGIPIVDSGAERTYDLLLLSAMLSQLNGGLLILPGFRLGWNEINKYYLWLLAGNIFLLTALLILVQTSSGLGLYIAVIAGAPAVALSLHMAHCIIDYRPKISFSIVSEVFASIFRLSVAPSIVHVANIFRISIPIVVAAGSVPLADVAAYSVTIRLAQQMVALAAMVSLPQIARLSLLLAEHNVAGFRQRSLRIFLASSGYALFFGLLLMLFGPELMKIWLSGAIQVSPWLCTFAGMLIIGWSVQAALQPTLLALGHGKIIARLAITEALFVALIGFPIIQYGGMVFLSAVLAIPSLFIGMPITIYYAFFQVEKFHPNSQQETRAI
jgi:O-antigen/teichoic acid export membrane protein